MDLQEILYKKAKAAKKAAEAMTMVSTETKNKALLAMADMLEQKVKFVITTDKTNQDNTLDLANAAEGDIVTLQTPNPLATGNNGAYLGFLPIKEAVELLEHREIKKAQLKQDIYDITGIADIMRGQTDAGETATAQQIKGVFGTMRFQDKQKQVQNFVVNVFEIIAQIICENWDAKTLQDITSTYLPSEEEKAQNATLQEQKNGTKEFTASSIRSPPRYATSLSPSSTSTPLTLATMFIVVAEFTVLGVASLVFW